MVLVPCCVFKLELTLLGFFWGGGGGGRFGSYITSCKIFPPMLSALWLKCHMQHVGAQASLFCSSWSLTPVLQVIIIELWSVSTLCSSFTFE